MGLSQREDSPVSGAKGWLAAGCCLLAILFQFAGPAVRAALQFDRHAIEAGQLWRLLTAHLVHLGWSHLLLNLAGLVLVWLLVGSVFSAGLWLGIALFVVLIIDAGLWILQPGLEWYVGLSGLLHGLLLAGLVGALALLPARRIESLALLLVVLVKLVYEQLLGPLPGSTSLAGAMVIVDAHLYGAVGGLIAGLAGIAASGRPHID